MWHSYIHYNCMNNYAHLDTNSYGLHNFCRSFSGVQWQRINFLLKSKKKDINTLKPNHSIRKPGWWYWNYYYCKKILRITCKNMTKKSTNEYSYVRIHTKKIVDNN